MRKSYPIRQDSVTNAAKSPECRRALQAARARAVVHVRIYGVLVHHPRVLVTGGYGSRRLITPSACRCLVVGGVALPVSCANVRCHCSWSMRLRDMQTTPNPLSTAAPELWQVRRASPTRERQSSTDEMAVEK